MQVVDRVRGDVEFGKDEQVGGGLVPGLRPRDRGARIGGRIADRGERRARPDSAHPVGVDRVERWEEHTSELQSLLRTSYAVFCLQKKTTTRTRQTVSAHRYTTREKVP